MSRIDFEKLLAKKGRQVLSVREYNLNDLNSRSCIPIKVTNDQGQTKILSAKILSTRDIAKYRKRSSISSTSIKVEVTKGDESYTMRNLSLIELQNYNRNEKSRDASKSDLESNPNMKIYQVQRLNSPDPLKVIQIFAEETNFQAFPDRESPKSSLQRKSFVKFDPRPSVFASILAKFHRRRSDNACPPLKKRVSFANIHTEVKYFNKFSIINKQKQKEKEKLRQAKAEKEQQGISKLGSTYETALQQKSTKLEFHTGVFEMFVRVLSRLYRIRRRQSQENDAQNEV